MILQLWGGVWRITALSHNLEAKTSCMWNIKVYPIQPCSSYTSSCSTRHQSTLEEAHSQISTPTATEIEQNVVMRMRFVCFLRRDTQLIIWRGHNWTLSRCRLHSSEHLFQQDWINLHFFSFGCLFCLLIHSWRQQVYIYSSGNSFWEMQIDVEASGETSDLKSSMLLIQNDAYKKVRLMMDGFIKEIKIEAKVGFLDFFKSNHSRLGNTKLRVPAETPGRTSVPLVTGWCGSDPLFYPVVSSDVANVVGPAAGLQPQSSSVQVQQCCW